MRITTLALKDLKLLLRDKLTAFFVIGFPIMLGLFFGLVMKGPDSSNTGRMTVAVVDLDQSDLSQQFIKNLGSNSSVTIEADEIEAARNSVRLGQRTAMIVLPADFHQSAGLMWQEQPEIQIGVDPSRSAEAAMLEGFVAQSMASLIGERFQNPQQFLPSIEQARADLATSPDVNPITKILLNTFFSNVEQLIDSASEVLQADSANEEDGSSSFEMNFVNIRQIDVTQQINPDSIAGQLKKIRSDWDISFPQGMMWGILACVAGFSLSIARERTRGTMMRLQAAPLTKSEILLGKAVACFVACLLVITIMTTLGVAVGMRPASFPKLIAASLIISFCFVGIMMTLSVLGKSEESVSGIGWSANMVMAMFGGAMMPVMFMPSFMQALSKFSPVFWSIRLIEGAVWREFEWSQMILPSLMLGLMGLAGIAVGSIILYRRQES